MNCRETYWNANNTAAQRLSSTVNFPGTVRCDAYDNGGDWTTWCSITCAPAASGYSVDITVNVAASELAEVNAGGAFGPPGGTYTQSVQCNNGVAFASVDVYYFGGAPNTTFSFNNWTPIIPPGTDATPPAGSFAINNGAASTNNASVTLTLNATDSQSGVSQMQFSNDNTTWSTAEPYAAAKSWTLAAGDGAKTVSAKFKDNAGNWSTAVSSFIQFDTLPPATSATPAGGVYGPGLMVTLASNETATIYYTTDGTMPTTGSAAYVGPISIFAATTFKYFALDTAGNSGPVNTAIYEIAASPPLESLLINNGAVYTNSLSVTLTLSCPDALSGCASMQFSNDNSTWSMVEAFTPAKTWQLSPGDGRKTVYAKFINGAGNIAVCSAAIMLDTGPLSTTLSTNPLSPDGVDGWFKTIPTIALSSNVSGTTYYRWGTGGYYSSRQPHEWISDGTPLNIRGDETGNWYTLPFSFTFYGTSYNQVFLSSNGLMSFESEIADYYDGAGLSSRLAIAPLWDDLQTDTRPGDDIYVFQPDADSVGFRWQAVTYGSEIDTNFEVILYRDGRIRFNYDTQNGGLYGTIGISKGDGVNYSVAYDGDISTTNHRDSIVFAPSRWNVYTNPFAAFNGENILYYYTADNSGHVETAKNQLFKVDTIVPIVSITSPLAGLTNNTMPLFSYTLSKVTSTNTVMVDGVTVNKLSGDTLDPLSSGPHTVRVDVTDYAGNTAFAEVVFTVVSYAPSVSIVSPAAGAANNSRPLLSYLVNYGTVTVKVDGVAVNKTSGNNLDVLADGRHAVRVESVDASGHTTFSEVKFVVDTTPPLASGMPNFIKIAAGDIHSTAITSDGNMWQWGRILDENALEGRWTDVASPTPAGTAYAWTAVATGLSSNLALKADGTLWAWGNNLYGQLGDGTNVDKYSPVQVGTAADWKTVSTSGLHSVALKNNGTLWAWGANEYGQLGGGARYRQYTAVQIGHDTNWAAVSTGSCHTIALKSDGTLWAWGANSNGQLGDGSGADQYEPVQIGNDTDWAAISAGSYHTVALKSDGSLWAWGANSNGQLGDGSRLDHYVPVRVEADNNWASISAGYDYTVVLKSDGTLWAWGSNSNGQLGDGTTNDKYIPEQIGAENTWSMVAAGVIHTLALKSNGTLWTWGVNWYGQLGDGTEQDRMTPHYTFAVSEALVINNGAAATNNTSVTLTLNAWDVTSGLAFMQFSNNGATWSTPEPYTSTTNWVLGSENGTKTVYAMFQDAAGNWSAPVSAWVILNAGPTKVSITSPVAGFTQNNAPLLSFAVNKSDTANTVKVDGVVVNKISGNTLDALAEGTHTVRVEAVDPNGIMGFAEVTFTVDSVIPIVTITAPAAGLSNNNQPVLTYTVNKDQTSNTVKIDGVAVNKTSGDTLDALTDGIHRLRVETTDQYGYRAFTEVSFTVDTEAPAGMVALKFKFIDAGTYHSTAIALNGTLWAWGLNGAGQLGDGTTISKLTPTLIGTDTDWAVVSAGELRTVALKTDGSLWAWGANNSGLLGDGTNVDRHVPTRIGSDKDWIAISAGQDLTTARKSDGSLWAWGWLGDGGYYGGYGDTNVPIMIGAPESSAVSAGSTTLTYTGKTAIGLPKSSAFSASLNTGEGYTGLYTDTGDVSAGAAYLLALQEGALWAAGRNDAGQLGFNGCELEFYSFTQVSTDTNWAAVSAVADHSQALKADGSLWAWGNGVSVPTKVGTDNDWAAVSAGATHTVALKTDGTLWAWGVNTFGQLWETVPLLTNLHRFK